MKTLLLSTLLLGLPAFAESNMYEITITNLTKGQPITPPVVAVHSPRTRLFKLGEPSSEGLGRLAEDGVTDVLLNELDQNPKVIRSTAGDGVILPGQSSTITIEANNPRYAISVVGMLARTNDAFVAKRNLSLYLKPGQSYSRLMSVYDAGTEENNEMGEYIPAPPFGNAGARATEGAEGFVTLHPGIQNIGDLEPLRDAFATKSARVKIKRLK